MKQIGIIKSRYGARIFNVAYKTTTKQLLLFYGKYNEHFTVNECWAPFQDAELIAEQMDCRFISEV